MADKSSARQWFQELGDRADPYAYLASLPDSDPPTFEQEWLDFKGNPQEVDLLKLWSTAVSGFANTGGGVLVWGIDARKDDSGVDAASALSLIADPSVFRSKLQQNVIATTNPPVQGIEVREFPGPSGNGFVACFIPESDNKPHRAEQAGRHKPYFIRVGDSFIIPNPAILRQMFYPRVTPSIRINVVAAEGNYHFHSESGQRAVFIHADVTNEGRGTARDLVIAVRTKMDGEWSAGMHWQKVDGIGGSAGFECVRALHPHMSTQCFRLAIKQPLALRGKLDVLHFAVYCRDAERQLMSLKITDDDLLRQRHVEAQPTEAR